MRVFSEKDVEKHNCPDSCWVVRNGRVYDVTPFLKHHPGDASNILNFAGKDIGGAMKASEPHCHSANAYRILSDFQIGVLEGHEMNGAIEEKHSDSLDWSKALMPQIGSLGASYVKWVNTPRFRAQRLFKSDFLEFFSGTPWFMAPLVWVPVILYQLAQCLSTSNDTIPIINFKGFELVANVVVTSVMYLIGVMAWLALEYVLHRFVYHMHVASPSWIRLHFTIHGTHHKNPFDPFRLVSPPLYPAGVIIAPVYYALVAIFPLQVARAVFAGGISAYLSYEMAHYYFHHGSPSPNSYLGRMKKWHMRHHFVDYGVNYGVLTNELDYLLGTNQNKNEQKIQ